MRPLQLELPDPEPEGPVAPLYGCRNCLAVLAGGGVLEGDGERRWCATCGQAWRERVVFEPEIAVATSLCADQEMANPLGSIPFTWNKRTHGVCVDYLGELRWRAVFNDGRPLFHLEFYPSTEGFDWSMRLADNDAHARTGTILRPRSPTAFAEAVVALIEGACAHSEGYVVVPTDWRA